MSLRERLRSRRRAAAARRSEESASARDEFERELVEHDVTGVREDTFAASGNGSVGPGLPTSTPREVYSEFERDEAAPLDPAP